jgi:hypothetical protein
MESTQIYFLMDVTTMIWWMRKKELTPLGSCERPNHSAHMLKKLPCDERWIWCLSQKCMFCNEAGIKNSICTTCGEVVKFSS